MKTSQRRDWIRLTAPLTAFGLTTMTMGMIASRHTGGYPAPPFIRLFFSDTIHLKAWLTTGAGVLALFQIVSAARVFELFHCASEGDHARKSKSARLSTGSPCTRGRVTGRLAHLDHDAAVRCFLDGLAATLEGAADVTAPSGAEVADVARLIRAVHATSDGDNGPPERLAVCRTWEAALDAARGPLVEPLAALTRWLSWTQNPNYRRHPPDASFLDNYGYAVIAGPVDGPPALAHASDVALGVLLLAPSTHYPLHAHPAVELYVTLTSDGGWWRNEGPWRREAAGAVIHHTSGVPHAMRAGTTPLLAVYVWRGTLGTHARLHPPGIER